MITRPTGFANRLGRSVVIIAGIHALILAAYAALTLVPGAAQAVTVIIPNAQFRASLPENVSVISTGRWTMQLASNDPQFVGELYKAGAVLVLPTLDAFCLSLG